MRLALRSDNIVEWLALRLGLVPTPAAEVWGGMALSGVLITASESGLTGRLAQAPATVEELAADLGLDPTPLGLVLDFLRASGHVRQRGSRYQLSRRSRRWLDPDAERSVARFVAANTDYWQWWASLPEVTRSGATVSHHTAEPDSPYWRRYITGQLDLARLSASEVARRVRVPAGARTVLDLGGGHGWYSAALCRRHPHLTATVIDLPGSARIGREIIAQAGLAESVAHRDGNVLTAELGAGYDVVLCFNLIHHLRPDEIVALLSRIRAALGPGGTLAILDAFAAPSHRRPASASYLGLFMYLSSGTAVYTPAQLHDWLAAAGFDAPRRTPMRRIPGLALYQAGARSASP